MKACPFCAESIQDAAIKCRYCKSDLGALPPASDVGEAPVPPAKESPVPAMQEQPQPPRGSGVAPPPPERGRRGPLHPPPSPGLFLGAFLVGAVVGFPIAEQVELLGGPRNAMWREVGPNGNVTFAFTGGARTSPAFYLTYVIIVGAFTVAPFLRYLYRLGVAAPAERARSSPERTRGDIVDPTTVSSAPHPDVPTSAPPPPGPPPSSASAPAAPHVLDASADLDLGADLEDEFADDEAPTRIARMPETVEALLRERAQQPSVSTTLPRPDAPVTPTTTPPPSTAPRAPAPTQRAAPRTPRLRWPALVGVSLFLGLPSCAFGHFVRGLQVGSWSAQERWAYNMAHDLCRYDASCTPEVFPGGVGGVAFLLVWAGAALFAFIVGR